MSKSVFVMGNDVFTDSYELSKGLGMEHRSIIALVHNHADNNIFNDVKIEKRRLHKKEANVYLFTELQATFLMTLMRNTAKIIKFKEKLVKEFYRQRRLLYKLAAQKQNQQWLEKRNETKEMRKELTDMIQEFIVYAREQGSKNADKYYMNISRMELTGLFLLEDNYPNAREVMDIKQLNLIEMADEAIARALKEGMDEGKPYKDCYKLAKERIKKLAEIFPPSPLPQLLMQTKQEIK